MKVIQKFKTLDENILDVCIRIDTTLYKLANRPLINANKKSVQS